MFSVTESALAVLAKALERMGEAKPPDACFRLVPDQDGLTLMVARPEPDDSEYEREGVTVLVMSEEIRSRCEGRTLDTDEEGSLILL